MKYFRKIDLIWLCLFISSIIIPSSFSEEKKVEDTEKGEKVKVGKGREKVDKKESMNKNGADGVGGNISLPFDLRWCIDKKELKSRIKGLQENYEDVLETQGNFMKYKGIFNFIFEGGKLVFITIRLIEEGTTYESILKDMNKKLGIGKVSEEEEGLIQWGNSDKTLVTLQKIGMEVALKYQTTSRNCLSPPEEEPIINIVPEEELEL